MSPVSPSPTSYGWPSRTAITASSCAPIPRSRCIRGSGPANAPRWPPSSRRRGWRSWDSRGTRGSPRRARTVPYWTRSAASWTLARDLGAPFVRVFPGADPAGGQSPEEADAIAARRLGTAAEDAADRGVRVLLETHDSHRTGADAIRVLGPVGHGSVGSLWDVMHTWLGGEQPAESYAALSPFLGYVQVKDIASPEDTTPLPLGAGVLPLGECVELLSRKDWDGWLCWEYEKRWYEEAAPLPELLAAGREHLGRLLNDAA